MNKKFAIAPVIIGIALVVILGTSDEKIEDSRAFHATLASPEQYSEGIFEQSIFVEEGQYQFRFVPNGDSPKKLSITLIGTNFQFSEDFVLNGTAHDTGISEYFTWDYDGQKIINIPSSQELQIAINPNGNVMGPVSVSLIKN